jgi:hypothetical protein
MEAWLPDQRSARVHHTDMDEKLLGFLSVSWRVRRFWSHLTIDHLIINMFALTSVIWRYVRRHAVGNSCKEIFSTVEICALLLLPSFLLPTHRARVPSSLPSCLPPFGQRKRMFCVWNSGHWRDSLESALIPSLSVALVFFVDLSSGFPPLVVPSPPLRRSPRCRSWMRKK